MEMYNILSPVVLIVFNRPETTKVVFKKISEVKPSKLYLIADGPREHNEDDMINCGLVREIIEKVDWDCSVYKNFSEQNIGCKRRVASGLSWVFENEERAIILEDDCDPSTSFFRYCDELLEKYKDDTRIMMISGDNFLLNKYTIQESYYFSKYHFIWGWATWSRAWLKYDLQMKDWPYIKANKLLFSYHNEKSEYKYWKEILDMVYDEKIDTWDYQWAYSMWKQSGLCICPSRNLICNIGFDDKATHTKKERLVSALKAQELSFPLRHPENCVRDVIADRIANRHFFNYPRNIIEKAWRKGIAILKRLGL